MKALGQPQNFSPETEFRYWGIRIQIYAPQLCKSCILLLYN